MRGFAAPSLEGQFRIQKYQPRPPLRASFGFKNINDAYNVDIWSLEPAKPWKPALVC